MRHARGRVRELTAKRRLLLPVEAIVQDVNMFLRGWVCYFKYGHSAERLSKIRHYVRMRIALFISKRHRRSRHFGVWALLNHTPNEYNQNNHNKNNNTPQTNKPKQKRPKTGKKRRR